MFRLSEEVAGFKLQKAVRDNYVHLMVIRSYAYEAYCYAASFCWEPSTLLRPTCPKCSRVTINE